MTSPFIDAQIESAVIHFLKGDSRPRLTLGDVSQSLWALSLSNGVSKKLTPKQISQRWNKILGDQRTDFAATFQRNSDVDIATLQLSEKPVYRPKADKLVFEVVPFSPSNRADLKRLSGDKLLEFNLFSSSEQISVPKSLTSAYRKALATPITDGAEWTMKAEDAYFANLSPKEIVDWRSRNSPFLLTNDQWSNFTRDLYGALQSDGFNAPLDIRMNGSSARLFSSPTKSVPASARDAIILYENESKTEVTQEKARDIITNYDEWLGPESQRQMTDIPRYRYVDLMYKLGIGERSDIDLQIASDAIGQKVEQLGISEGVSPDKIKVASYGFYKRSLVDKVLPNTNAVMQQWSSDPALGIDFTFALFDGIGPLD